MEYKDKLIIADTYLTGKIGLRWNDLPDINSLDDVESREEIYKLCNDRLEDAGYPFFDEE